MKAIRFLVDSPGDAAAGILPFDDELTVYLDSGEPGGEPGEFEEFLRKALEEWFDGARVVFVEDER